MFFGTYAASVKISRLPLGLELSVGEDSAPRKAVRYFVSGTVQGVGYRFFVERAAVRLGLKGFVKNLSDGRVEIYAVGAAEGLATLAADLGRGPAGASVANVIAEKALVDPGLAEDFLIER